MPRISSVIACFLLIGTSLAISALRFGSDVSTNDVEINYDSSLQRFYMVLSNSFQRISSTFVMCFRLRTITISGNTCSMDTTTSSFQCLEYDGSASTKVYTYFELTNDLQTVSNIQTYTPNEVLSGTGYGSEFISLDGTITNSIAQIYLSVNPATYEVISNQDRIFADSEQLKYNFASTSVQTLSLTTSNVLAPHNFQCFVYQNDFVTYIFYGGVIRFQTTIMMFSIGSYTISGTYFSGWQAISLSQSHAFRDMLGWHLNNGSLYDMYSLIADTPYDDTSTNIEGLNDLTLLFSSGKRNQKLVSYFYITQFYRYYETTSSGDQTIMQKIENQYCLASYFETYSTVTPSNNFTGSPIDSNYMHQDVQCFLPNLDLGASLSEISIMLTFLLFLVL